ncbi:MAG: hypothetical protein M3077_05290 [Candidatus Dormibacteraeota bacterium]|nr:hypothetical protein [Candidatus Dormibacteraeota bacterium]
MESRLCAAIRKLAGGKAVGPLLQTLPLTDRRVSRELHLRILDAVEDRQYTSRPARSRLTAVGLAVLILAGAGLVQLQRTRSDALAAAAPTISDVAPPAGAREVGVDGQFRIQFTRRPLGTPTLTHQPSDGKQHVTFWDGTTLLVEYSGLRFGQRYELVLDAQYQSHLRDIGHFVKRWTFVAEGPPRLVRTEPIDGAGTVARFGQLSIGFSRRPTSDPVVTLQPPAMLEAGAWNGTVWTAHYSDLQPRTNYAADVTVASSDPTARTHQTWTFMTEAGAPPDAVPLVWYSTSSPWLSPSGDPIRYVALDWSGANAGSVYLTGKSGSRQNADGSWIGLTDGSGAMNRQGRVVPTRTLGGALWSDVPGRYCNIGFDPWSPVQWLEVGQVGGTVRRVVTLGPTPGQSGFSLIACSGLTDRAVLGQQVQGGYLDVRVIGLSTGRTLYSHAYANAPQMLVGSRDGRYLAESSLGSGASATVIHRLSDGAVVARLTDQRVVGFSWDASLVITAPSWGVQTPGEIRLLDWHSGAVLWRLAGNPAATGQLPVVALPQPNGKRFMVGVGNPSSSGDVDGIFLLQADGHADKIVNGSVFLAAFSG